MNGRQAEAPADRQATSAAWHYAASSWEAEPQEDPLKYGQSNTKYCWACSKGMHHAKQWCPHCGARQ